MLGYTTKGRPMSENVTMRTFTWARQARAFPAATFHNGDLPVSIDPIFTTHTGPALYDDGGPFIVVDPIEGLEYCVVDSRNMQTVRKIRLDLREACNFAYDMNCADKRWHA